MPRPGPRPYECVRRAWHSERHQPVRGSIIQQIFRVVNDAHSPATKKNKEWQEKLPVVVLKAEEIMYSKANSEAEYLNPDTLWDRLNDAVNTIIRRDETTETGDLLPPCVEAALNLGCKPVRTSRSDRHNNPKTYLPPRIQQPPPPVPSKPVVGSPLNYPRVTTSTVSPVPVSDANQHTQQNSKLAGSSNYPFSESFPSNHHQPLSMEGRLSLNLGSAYPLYYGYEAREPQPRTTIRDNTCSDTIFVGRPVIPVTEPSGIGRFENFSYGRYHHVANRIAKETGIGTQAQPPDRECDLSLRLGRCVHPCSSSKSSSAYEIDDVGLRVSQESKGSKFSHLSLQRTKEFSFYPRETGFGSIDSTSTKCNIEGEDQNLEATLRKRKVPLGNEEDGQFCRDLGVPSNPFTGRPEAGIELLVALLQTFAEQRSLPSGFQQYLFMLIILSLATHHRAALRRTVRHCTGALLFAHTGSMGSALDQLRSVLGGVDTNSTQKNRVTPLLKRGGVDTNSTQKSRVTPLLKRAKRVSLSYDDVPPLKKKDMRPRTLEFLEVKLLVSKSPSLFPLTWRVGRTTCIFLSG
ncbi:hypothetical protein RJT34_32517 [Clitoria ternatea]|uniref:Uncharacterized protein n=1 Tax=Clitoria ternatea TaxID=43366 RepID=A0AAN9EXM2_CLITE